MQRLSGICEPQLHTQCIPKLLAFVNNRAEDRNCQAFVYNNCRLNVCRHCLHLQTVGLNTGITQALYTAITHSMYTGIAGICKQLGRIKELPCICIPRLRAQCVQELLAFVNNLAEYRNCQAFAYRNYILNVYENCWRL